MQTNIELTTNGLTINKPLLDWLTVTSYEDMYYHVQRQMLANAIKDTRATIKEPVKRLQYLGLSAHTGEGTIFIGDGTIDGRFHYMSQIGGELCNDECILYPTFQGIREGGWLRVRRIDIQMTTNRPDGWSQWALFNRAKKAGKSVGWFESRDMDGVLTQTVYIGKRTSDKFLRVYEKRIGDAILLRCEYEIKGNLAGSVSRMIADGTATPASLFKLFIQQTDDGELSALYLPLIEYAPTAEKPKIIKPEAKTNRWLLERVLPTFVKVINEHDTGNEVADAFLAAIEARDRWCDRVDILPVRV